jgi:uncharacterized protein (DUF305 family)
MLFTMRPQPAASTVRIAAGVAALAVAVVVSGCSGPSSSDSHADHTQAESTPLISGQPAGFDADDVAFASQMIPHHQQAVDLSALVPDHTTNPQVIQLAKTISAEQAPEIETLKAFLVQWKEDPDSDTGHGGHGDMAMNGMVDDATMQRLKSLNGAQFDTLWLQSMIGHHRGAIEMSNAEIANGANVDAKTLAHSIVTAQQGEIDQMNKMLGTS